mgnify:CR=1 FL=1
MSSFQETAKELIDKGSEFVSGLASTAGDVATKAKIKMKIADLVLEENKLMQQLGRDVYEQLADDAELIARVEENAAHKQAYEDELTTMSATVEDVQSSDDPQPIDVDAIVVSDEPGASGDQTNEKDGK